MKGLLSYMFKFFIFSLNFFFFSSLIFGQAQPESVHGLAIYGEVKYPKNFKNFDYANPRAPKGGMLRMQALGTYDSFNPFIIKGQAAVGIAGLVYATLTVSSQDEPSSCYGYLAESIILSPDRTWVIFNLRSNATFHDRTAIRADDVIYSFNLLITKGSPFYKSYYKNVKKVEKVNELAVKFTLGKDYNRELPVILGQFPIFSKAFIQKYGFDRSDLVVPLGSGPYKIADFKAGHYISYERIKNWWGEKLPVNLGRYNFDRIRYDYFRDMNIAFEAFKSHTFDLYIEAVAKNWATGYNFPAFKEGKVIKKEIPDRYPAFMQGFLYNTRRSLFQDRRVRQALAYAFDFEWANKYLFYSSYKRTKSYFDRSELASNGLPQGEELEILTSYHDYLPKEIFTQPFSPPSTEAPSSLRENLSKAKVMLEEAGWRIRNNQLVNLKTGKPFIFEILITQASLERVLQGFVNNLKRLGIKAHLRTVESSQYTERVSNYDFDMISSVISQSTTPGNEQREFWLSSNAEIPGGMNLAGVKNPVIDAMVNLVISAPDKESLIMRVHALDRALLWEYYVIPGWHSAGTRLAYWLPLAHPAVMPTYGMDLMCWWIGESTLKKED
jgi:microcin C transport system substrate-binding protein